MDTDRKTSLPSSPFAAKSVGGGMLRCPDCIDGLKRGIVGGYAKCWTCSGTGKVSDPRIPSKARRAAPRTEDAILRSREYADHIARGGTDAL